MSCGSFEAGSISGLHTVALIQLSFARCSEVEVGTYSGLFVQPGARTNTRLLKRRVNEREFFTLLHSDLRGSVKSFQTVREILALCLSCCLPIVPLKRSAGTKLLCLGPRGPSGPLAVRGFSPNGKKHGEALLRFYFSLN